MKRTALIRKAPMRHWRRKPEDQLDPAVRSHVLNRDRECVVHKLARRGVIEADECRNKWGDPIFAWTLEVLTYEHVHEHAQMGKRAPNDPRWGVAACAHHNVNGGTSKHRAAILAYLAELEAAGKL